MKKIEVTFTGENRHNQVADYFRRYHPAGYDTFVLKEDNEKVVVVRNLSCD